MFYLVHCDTHGCVDFQVFVGISDNKNGLMELLFNFHKQYLSTLTFEDSHYDLQIYKINEENYNYLLDKIQNNITKIEENYETIKYNPECQNCDYISVFLKNDGPQYDIFDKTFHKKYNSIIKKSKQIIT
jgi:hypothetical protein